MVNDIDIDFQGIQKSPNNKELAIVEKSDYYTKSNSQ